ncbi:6-phosphofructokinase [Gilvimarinus sp. SDUM040013]|uniref:Pyrophosphate--fructose 6-phosphate 1-phosphotransferase n=1 Tax=Gilvimarinus gilvus TaxID=3058038 RepID=A0ABU4RZ46_9GAMM|nr:6-phosphofructokinase [Gilvimarinus sp. SDUM040013]MDO3386631.1 6-phosphofructokinase [Gilvimarinus sp. SDUM040013]MDX6849482.1 6-phosphofructokinase [Gilvimarinus sp. SDUM040013]
MANAFYGQSGGVSAVINATAAGIIEGAKAYPELIDKVFAGRDGILGALYENLVDISEESEETLAGLVHTPGGAFGSCRHKLQNPNVNHDEYQRLIDVFRAHDIRYFFYNGGGDSQDTTRKLADAAHYVGYDLTCIGVPKTIDNDLPETDCCPGFGSVAKYVAVSALEASLDVASMHKTSTKVFVMEVMGRHTGWIAAAAGLACDNRELGPDVILVPEITFDRDAFVRRVQQTVAKKGFCIVVAAEGIRDDSGNFVSQMETTDAFGHAQLGGVAPRLVDYIKQSLNYKCHWSVCDYLQRAARHIASKTDVDQAYAVGKAAVDYAAQGLQAVMPGIVREQSVPYQWHIEPIHISKVAGGEKHMPRHYMSKDGFSLTQAGRDYFAPLIEGEAYPPYRNGLPDYQKCRNRLLERKLPEYFGKTTQKPTPETA